MKKRSVVLLCLLNMLIFGFLSPSVLHAESEVDSLKKQLKKLEQKIDEMEERSDEIEERVDKTELHTSTDKLSLGFEFRTRMDSIHFQDVLTAPDSLMEMFFKDYPTGLSNATKAEIQAAMAGIYGTAMNIPDKNDVDNDSIFTNRFRLNMKSKVNSKLSFAGRLSAYKVWGDSAGVQNFQGSMGDINLDGTTASLPQDDSIHLERAYFNYRGSFLSMPVNFSLGRRPSTLGPPLEYGENSLEGGSPLAHIINWQFDGASLNFGLEEVTGIPGAAFKLCYGVGFESDWGNSTSMKAGSQLDDVNLFGFIISLYDNESTSAVINYAHASDITDGFIGTTVMPFTVSLDPDSGEYVFEQNSGGFVSRTEPTTNLGDWDAATMLLRTNLSESLDVDIDMFFSLAWSHVDPENTSSHLFYDLMGYGLLNSNGELKSRDGYSIYAGIIFPMPFNARWGFEYNFGTQYWFNFTGAEDSLVDSKLGTRGQVFETYYIQPVFDNSFFLKLGGRYYDYHYTGSGNPLGAPVKIDDATSMDSLFPVVSSAWNVYMSATVRF